MSCDVRPAFAKAGGRVSAALSESHGLLLAHQTQVIRIGRQHARPSQITPEFRRQRHPLPANAGETRAPPHHPPTPLYFSTPLCHRLYSQSPRPSAGDWGPHIGLHPTSPPSAACDLTTRARNTPPPSIRRGCFSPAQAERSSTSRVYRACALQVKEDRPQIERQTPQHGCCAGHAGHATAAGQSCEYVCAGECHPAAWHDQGGCPANIQGMCLHCLLWFVRGLTCRVEISADEGSRRARDRPRVDACAWHIAGDTAEDGIA